MTEQAGLIFEVCRPAEFPDCTNGGMSARFAQGTVIHKYIDGTFPATRDQPAYRLESHVAGCVRLVPVEERNGAGPMMGGNFGHTCDSRFARAVEKLTGARFYGAVAIHDRYEEHAL